MESTENRETELSHLNLSNTCLASGNLEAAIQHLHEALRINPHHPGAYNNLGRIFYRQRRIDEAIFYFKKALRINPRHWESHYNLAHSLVQQNQIEEAATHYHEVLKIIPDHLNAHFNVGLIYVELENYPLAEIHLNKALALDPQNLEAAKQLGHIYLQLGQIDNAFNLYQKALELSPTLAEAHHNLAILYLKKSEPLKALSHFEKAFESDPTNETAKHMIKALKNVQSHTKDSLTSVPPHSPVSAPLSYITQLFDQYADYYDEHLKTTLKYEAPGLLRNAVGRCLASHTKAMRVLDLGCGTGLGGIVFRDLALELVGVDLSTKMLEKAKALDTYEKLIQKDILEYLNSECLNESEDFFDLIFASDVFVYSGSLEAIFSGVQKKLIQNGLFAFTIESITGSSFKLQSSGRFAHSEAYITTLALDHQFKILVQEDIVLREQNGIPLMGQLFVLFYQ